MYVLLNPMHFPSYMNHKKMTFFLRFVNLISNTRKNKKYLKDDLLSVFFFFIKKQTEKKNNCVLALSRIMKLYCEDKIHALGKCFAES